MSIKKDFTPAYGGISITPANAIEVYIRFNDVGIPAIFRQRDLSLSIEKISK